VSGEDLSILLHQDFSADGVDWYDFGPEKRTACGVS
jgi:hypothetical protein